MNYDIQELAPIAATLIEKFNTANGGTADREATKQFMDAVAFCIDEVLLNDDATEVAAENMTSADYYETGAKLVQEKVEKAQNLYNELLLEFKSYGLKCLDSAMLKEAGTFFMQYDPLFYPHLDVVELSYPIIKDISKLKGIDKIYEFLLYIKDEQEFLKTLPDGAMEAAFARFSNPTELKVNLTTIAIRDIVFHALAGKPLTNPEITGADLKKCLFIVKQDGPAKSATTVRFVLDMLLKSAFEDPSVFSQYTDEALNSVLSDLAK